MSNLKSKLIKMGHEQPELRDDLRPILDYITKESYNNGDYGKQDRNEAFYPEKGHKDEGAVGTKNSSRRRRAAGDVQLISRNEWEVQWKGDLVRVTLDGRHQKYSVSFPEGTVDVQISGNGIKNVKNWTGAPGLDYAASQIVKKIKSHKYF